MSGDEINSSTITREIQRKLSEAARLRKADPADLRIKAIISEVDQLSRMRMRLSEAPVIPPSVWDIMAI
ncbi:MAG: hypothetical protein ACTHOJ_10760 [Sphingomonas oligoaromativorans]